MTPTGGPILRLADNRCDWVIVKSSGELRVGANFAAHKTIVHSRGEYARGDVTTNSVEGYFSIFKRGMKGVYQHCGEKHLHRYLAEYDFRFNHRVALGFNDGDRATLAVKNAAGKRLTYRGRN